MLNYLARSVISLLVVSSVMVVLPAFAGSLSERSMETFEKPSDPAEDTQRSPFVPQSVEKGEMTAQDLQLTGVAVNQDEAYALVSGHVLRLGDRVGGFRVRYIGNDYIVLKQLDQSVTLRLVGGL